MWEMGIQGKLWRVIRNIYNVNSSCVFLNGCKSDYFDIYQGIAQGCTLSPTLFLIFIDGLMKEIERTVPSLPSLDWFSNIKSFLCGVWNLRKEKLYPEDYLMNIQLQTAPSRDAWSMAVMLWRSVHEYLFIYSFMFMYFPNSIKSSGFTCFIMLIFLVDP